MLLILLWLLPYKVRLYIGIKHVEQPNKMRQFLLVDGDMNFLHVFTKLSTFQSIASKDRITTKRPHSSHIGFMESLFALPNNNAVVEKKVADRSDGL